MTKVDKIRVRKNTPRRKFSLDLHESRSPSNYKVANNDSPGFWGHAEVWGAKTTLAFSHMCLYDARLTHHITHHHRFYISHALLSVPLD
jgi:hypothetical protein